ncbi:MAG: hypothetical protein BWY63_00893 [Chloroflexi bacterium ADurb.Bin360]|nr:MAG: hypothetical protein BWY63_00893 [Chloroflexi bacterium ADurb.Bin360]
MIKKQSIIIMLIAALTLVTLACGGTISTANIKSARLSVNESGSPEMTTFNQDDLTIYLTITLANAPDDTVVKTSWIAADVEGVDLNTLIDETELTSGDGELYFNIANNQLWPLGQYKVEIYLNDKLDRTLEYQVQ